MCVGIWCGFVNAILRNIIRDKEKIKNSLPNITKNMPKKMYQNLTNFYNKKTINKIIEFFMIEPSLDLICSKKITSHIFERCHRRHFLPMFSETILFFNLFFFLDTFYLSGQKVTLLTPSFFIQFFFFSFLF